MKLVRVSVRLNPAPLKQAQKALRTKSVSETLQKALDLVTEKTAHDHVIRRHSGVGTADAFAEE